MGEIDIPFFSKTILRVSLEPIQDNSHATQNWNPAIHVGSCLPDVSQPNRPRPAAPPSTPQEWRTQSRPAISLSAGLPVNWGVQFQRVVPCAHPALPAIRQLRRYENIPCTL